MYHYTDGGLRNVWLANGYQIKKTPYGEAVSFHDGDGLTEAICIALTQKAGVLTGIEFRYIRSAGMLLSQPALGKIMGIDGQSIARWEKTGKVPRWADKLIRLFTPHTHAATSPFAARLRASKPWSAWSSSASWSRKTRGAGSRASRRMTLLLHEGAEGSMFARNAGFGCANHRQSRHESSTRRPENGTAPR